MTPPLNFDEAEASYSDDPVERIEAAPRKRTPAFLAVLLLAATGIFLQGTFAGNISIDSGKRFEFGQGVRKTVACSGSVELNVLPSSTFVNASNNLGAYKFNSVTVSQIPDSCFGVDFSINAFNDSDNAPLSLFSTDSKTAVVYDNGGTFEVGTGGTGTSITSGSGTFTITFDTPTAASASVFRITIQSGVHTPKTYKVGEIGAGGGKVFYVSATPFSCGATLSSICTSLEAAPWNWNATRDVDTAWCSSGIAATQSVIPGTHPTDSAIGLGLKNTMLIAANCTGGAANVALAYRGGGFTDWHLPDQGEYLQMYLRYSILGIDGGNYYNLSDEASSGAGFVGMLGTGGNASLSGKSVAYRVRPVRAF
jgi:hypothetical protein